MIRLTMVISLYGIGGNALAARNDDVFYAESWGQTEAPPGVATPPFELIWERNPAWIPFHREGHSQGQVRRVAATDLGLVTLINRTFYLLDKKSGRTLWAYRLSGYRLDVADWKVMDNVIFYAMRDWTEKGNPRDLRGALDLTRRSLIWQQPTPDDEMRYFGNGSPEWVIALPDGYALFGTEQNVGFKKYLPVDLLSSDGRIRFRVDLEFPKNGNVFLSWFVRDNHLNVLTRPDTGGIDLKTYDLATGKAYLSQHIYGNDKVPNTAPYTLRDDSTLVLAYRPLAGKPVREEVPTPFASHLIEFDLKEGRKLWDASLTLDEKKNIKRLLPHPTRKELLTATIYPAGYLIVDGKLGTVKKHDDIPGYVEWTEANPLLYSHPYIFTSAISNPGKDEHRKIDKDKYSLIALNVETGKVDWSYELGDSSTAPVNFVWADNTIYVSRYDGKVMAFQPALPLKSKQRKPETVERQ